MGKTYQNEKIDTSQPAVSDTVSVALAELAGEMREGLLARAVQSSGRALSKLSVAECMFDSCSCRSTC
ncbi:MAG: hypothetical protein ACRDRH_21895 [Pseudonocardia sp.]